MAGKLRIIILLHLGLITCRFDYGRIRKPWFSWISDLWSNPCRIGETFRFVLALNTSVSGLAQPPAPWVGKHQLTNGISEHLASKVWVLDDLAQLSCTTQLHSQPWRLSLSCYGAPLTCWNANQNCCSRWPLVRGMLSARQCSLTLMLSVCHLPFKASSRTLCWFVHVCVCLQVVRLFVCLCVAWLCHNSFGIVSPIIRRNAHPERRAHLAIDEEMHK